MALFSFRSRLKSLDWKLISCVDIENIINKTSISELQSIIDEVTFSSFDKNDAQYVNVENLAKLVNIMQLIIEYFLYCQEEQFKSIQITQQKHHQLRKQKHTLEKKYLVVQENAKGYENQINYLQELLLSSSSPDGNNEDKLLQIQHQVKNATYGGRFLSSSSSSALPIQYLDSILSSERETRENIMTVFEKQKVSFFHEIGGILNMYFDRQDKKEQFDFQNTVIQHDSKKMNEKVMDKIDQLFQLILLNQQQQQQQMQAMQQSDNKENIHENNNNNTSSSSISAAVTIAAAQLQITELEERLEVKETEYRNTINHHLQQERYLSSQVEELMELNKRQTMYIDNAVNNLSQAKLMAARMAKNTLAKALLRKISHSFSQWKSHTSHHRERENEIEYTRRLKTELKIHGRKMDEMKLLLDREKEKVILEKARYHILLRSSNSGGGVDGSSTSQTSSSATAGAESLATATATPSGKHHSPQRSPLSRSPTNTKTTAASSSSSKKTPINLTIAINSPTTSAADEGVLNTSTHSSDTNSNQSTHTQWHDDDEVNNEDGGNFKISSSATAAYTSPIHSSSSKFNPSQNQINVFMQLLNQLSPNSQERARLALQAAEYSDSDKSQSQSAGGLSGRGMSGSSSVQSSPRQLSSSLLSSSPLSPNTNRSRTHSQQLFSAGGGFSNTKLTRINDDGDEEDGESNHNNISNDDVNNRSSISVYSSINVNNDEVKETSEWLVQASKERINNQIYLKSEELLTEEIAQSLTQRIALYNIDDQEPESSDYDTNVKNFVQ